MNRVLLDLYRSTLRVELVRLDAIEVCCGTCLQWTAGLSPRTWRCAKFDAVPPPAVQAAGCDEWTFDSIPF
jgi:hypothetical protein